MMHYRNQLFTDFLDSLCHRSETIMLSIPNKPDWIIDDELSSCMSVLLFLIINIPLLRFERTLTGMAAKVPGRLTYRNNTKTWSWRFPVGIPSVATYFSLLTYVLTYLYCLPTLYNDLKLNLRWFGGVVVRTLDLRLSITGSIPSHETAGLFLR